MATIAVGGSHFPIAFLFLSSRFQASRKPNTANLLPNQLPLADAELLRPPSTLAVVMIIVGNVAIPDGNFTHFSAIVR